MKKWQKLKVLYIPSRPTIWLVLKSMFNQYQLNHQTFSRNWKCKISFLIFIKIGSSINSLFSCFWKTVERIRLQYHFFSNSANKNSFCYVSHNLSCRFFHFYVRQLFRIWGMILNNINVGLRSVEKSHSHVVSSLIIFLSIMFIIFEFICLSKVRINIFWFCVHITCVGDIINLMTSISAIFTLVRFKWQTVHQNSREFLSKYFNLKRLIDSVIVTLSTCSENYKLILVLLVPKPELFSDDELFDGFLFYTDSNQIKELS